MDSVFVREKGRRQPVKVVVPLEYNKAHRELYSKPKPPPNVATATHGT